VIRHGVNGASPSLISRENHLSEVLFLLIDREPACNIQNVRQMLEKTTRGRTWTHIHEKNETPDNSWTKKHQNGKHWGSSQTGGTFTKRLEEVISGNHMSIWLGHSKKPVSILEYAGWIQQREERDSLKEVPCGVCRVDTPPIIHGNVENTKGDDEECCRPFGLESNGDHNACDEAEQ
jgi:hypothetical protein